MKKKHIQLLIGLVVTIVALYFAFRGIKLSDLMDALRRTNWWWGIPVIVSTMVSFYWRAVRWKILLQPTLDRMEPPRNPSAGRLFGPLMIGFGFNNILPLRAGEFARPLALMKQDDVPYGAGLSTVFLERLVDMIILLILFIGLPFYMRLNPTLELKDETFGSLNQERLQSLILGISVIASILTLGVLTCLVPSIRVQYIRLLHLLPLIPTWIKHKLEAFIESFAKGFESLKDFKAVALVFIHSVGIWLTIALTYQLMSYGFPGVKVGFTDSLGMLVLICVAISLPSSPGFWGLFEFGGLFALLMMGAVENTPAGHSAAVAFTMVVHFLQWAPITIVGLYYAAKLHVSASEANAATERGDEVIDDLASEAEHEAERT